MKKRSLCWQITCAAAAILCLCAGLLTLFSSYQAGKQLTAVASETAQTIQSAVVGVEGATVSEALPRASIVSEAKARFDLAGVGVMAAVCLLGTGLVYCAARRALAPLSGLSESMAAITENDLAVHLEAPASSTEVSLLYESFNAMMERLHSSFAMQKRFSASAAHELRTPLSTILTSAQVARLGEPSLEDYAKSLASVERSAKRLQNVIEDLLRLCDESTPLELQDVPLAEMFSRILEELASPIREKGLETMVDCGSFPQVVGNYSLLYRAFFNLVENAVKYGTSSGVIRIRSERRDGMGVISVSDTGCGIPKEQLAQIFEPFYRVDPSRSRRVGGAGLGLSVVKSIVERHGWMVTADSTIGVGSTFSVVQLL